MTRGHYILTKDHKIKDVDLMTWARWFETANRMVTQTRLANGKYVSTVFLGLDHNFGMGKPHLFETMCFTSEDSFEDIDRERCATWRQALKQHEKMVQKHS